MTHIAQFVAPISLLSLVVAIYVGFKREVNTGIVSIAMAFVIGFFVFQPSGANPESAVALSSQAAKAVTLISGWPTSLFFMLLGMTLLFSIARVNKTLELMARKTAYLSKGNTKLLPGIFFVLSVILAAIGPGNIAVSALVLPIALAVSKEEKINPLLMAGVTIAGANAGGLSPIAPTGIITANLSAASGFDIGSHVFLQMILSQMVIATILFFCLGGMKLKKNKDRALVKPESFSKDQILTIAIICMVVITIIFGHWNIGFAAFVGAALLLVLKAADEKAAIAGIPWSTLILICGVGVLVNVITIAGGIDILTQTLSNFMNEKTSGAILTIVSGLMSAVSSASGVVMPTLIPTVSGLVETLGVNGQTLITSIVLGAHFVTNSPLSTLGALAMASAEENVDKSKFFNGLLLLGFGGVLLGAVMVFFGIVG